MKLSIKDKKALEESKRLLELSVEKEEFLKTYVHKIFYLAVKYQQTVAGMVPEPVKIVANGFVFLVPTHLNYYYDSIAIDYRVDESEWEKYRDNLDCVENLIAYIEAEKKKQKEFAEKRAFVISKLTKEELELLGVK